MNTKEKQTWEKSVKEIGIMLDDIGVFTAFPSERADVERIISNSHKRPRYNQIGKFSADEFHIHLLRWIDKNITFNIQLKQPVDGIDCSGYMANVSNERIICYVSTTMSMYIAELIRVCIDNNIKLTLRYYNSISRTWLDQEMVK